MVSFLGLITRFSSLMKILTFICLGCMLLAYLCPFVHPSDFWILPFFGLAYPVILLFTFLVLMYWIIMKSRMSFLVILVLIFGGKLHFRTVSMPFGTEENKQNDSTPVLKITSYNVRLFDLYEWSDAAKYVNRNNIFKYVHDQNSDVICFQEFYHQDRPTKFPTRDTLKGLLETPFCHEKYSHKLEGRQNFGIAMLSKYQMISRGDIVF